jgi:hypothetical protein
MILMKTSWKMSSAWAVVLGEEVNGGIDFLLVAAEEFLECPDPYLPDRD